MIATKFQQLHPCFRGQATMKMWMQFNVMPRTDVNTERSICAKCGVGNRLRMANEIQCIILKLHNRKTWDKCEDFFFGSSYVVSHIQKLSNPKCKHGKRKLYADNDDVEVMKQLSRLYC